MAIQFSAAPTATVAIYPNEGGSYVLSSTNQALLQLQVSNDVTTGAGSFSLTLAPGGPSGQVGPSWASILTPMSLVIIGLRRGDRSRIVMIGVVISPAESFEWSSEPKHNTTVSGVDFTYFFNNFSYYNLTLLLGLGLGAIGSLGLPSVVSQSLIQGRPDQIGQAWFSKIMAGPNGVLSKTSFTFAGTKVLFDSLIGTWFEQYPAPIEIPMGANYIGDEGSWMSKFGSFFPFPWYEVFVQTAPVGTYPSAEPPSNLAVLPGYSDAGAFFVCRVNPTPFMQTTDGTSVTLNTSRWDALTRFTSEGANPIASQIAFSLDEIRNFYILFPTFVAQQFGGSNDTPNAFVFSQQSWVDEASIQKYGYRPEITETRWMADPAGTYAQNLVAQGKGPLDFQRLVADLALRVPSHHEPTALMARASVTMNLRPDILPGNIWTYPPFRSSPTTWDFYITGVSHTYAFGQTPITALTLARGLPTEIYDDPAMLLAIHQGNAQRQNGVFQQGLPTGSAPPLTALNLSSAPSLAAALVPGYSLPQSGTPPQ